MKVRGYNYYSLKVYEVHLRHMILHEMLIVSSFTTILNKQKTFSVNLHWKFMLQIWKIIVWTLFNWFLSKIILKWEYIYIIYLLPKCWQLMVESTQTIFSIALWANIYTQKFQKGNILGASGICKLFYFNLLIHFQ